MQYRPDHILIQEQALYAFESLFQQGGYHFLEMLGLDGGGHRVSLVAGLGVLNKYGWKLGYGVGTPEM